MADRPPTRRCVIYTRKSSDEGLDQAYNSLDAQRDASSAYIASQKHEGWVLVDKTYADGGFSGGSLQRPALQSLLEDMTKGLVDIIVVYKIDRLTRSLADFAKLTEVLDKHQVSFVAVTQQFNTSTSMGRLTLNVLLSFAQFEREVSGERIRDKIAASKQRGMWMGGHPPLGYDVRDRKLIINEHEAETVRHIYSQYLKLKSVRHLNENLDQANIRSKCNVWKDGTLHGDNPFSRGAISHLLKNRIYCGMIPHKDKSYKGEHEPIISEELFDRVQTALAAQGPGEDAKLKRASPALLKGLAFDAAGNRLQPTHCSKKGSKYRYYVSAPTIRNARANPDGLRVPAADLERIVITAIAGRLRDQKWVSTLAAGLHASAADGLDQQFEMTASAHKNAITSAATLADQLNQKATTNTGLLKAIISSVDVSKSAILIRLGKAQIGKQLAMEDPQVQQLSHSGGTIDINVTGQFLRCGKQVRLVLGNDDIGQSEPDKKLIQEVLRARLWFQDLSTGRVASIAELARRDNFSAPYISLKISLAFLAPGILELIIDGTQPRSLTPEKLKKACPLPISWDEQRAILLT